MALILSLEPTGQYLQNRAMEAIRARDYILAVKLLLLVCYTIAVAPPNTITGNKVDYEDLLK